MISDGALLALGIGVAALLLHAAIQVALMIVAQRWAREAAAERLLRESQGQLVSHVPIEHAELGAELLRFPDRPRRP